MMMMVLGHGGGRGYCGGAGPMGVGGMGMMGQGLGILGRRRADERGDRGGHGGQRTGHAVEATRLQEQTVDVEAVTEAVPERATPARPPREKPCVEQDRTSVENVPARTRSNRQVQ